MRTAASIGSVIGEGANMKILIADDHGIVRQGLKALINLKPDMEVVGEASNGYMAVELARDLSPDVVIMDITMPKMNGIDATQQILAQNPAIKVVILSVHSERNIVSEALKAGAVGYVLKTNLFDELSRALQSVTTNGYYLSPRITDFVVNEFLDNSRKTREAEKARITTFERQVIQLLAEGKTTKQIALFLHKSPKTVEASRHKIAEKIGTSGVAELTKYAILEGLTPLE
jgi:DNA-binding NarL/FixJ family response regulator